MYSLHAHPFQMLDLIFSEFHLHLHSQFCFWQTFAGSRTFEKRRFCSQTKCILRKQSKGNFIHLGITKNRLEGLECNALFPVC